ncbi:DUF5110 domain-containing protein [Hymenobacter rubripertinctus]|uniref:DUF5110 domain-containing protein n=1 Tax=Hymenobacter rubripertinctus TaxID=2029981 RepID=A0A418QSU1_9BACT|nr:DUF5110 domain-containing protein [Hymenobacter rubripertinctus]RIY08183.1 DUF5110 domain-containing protein [Hymenobacter rubripertinctus]
MLYSDGGEGYGYEQGQRTVRRFRVTGSGTGLLLQQQTESDYQPSWRTSRVVVHGLPSLATTFSTDGQPAQGLEVTTETGLTGPAWW